MGLSVQNNIGAMNAYRNLSTTQNNLSKSLERLSSGFRINRAADDAAGAAVEPFELKLLEQALAARAIPAAMTAAEIVFLIGCSLVVTRVRSTIPRRPDASDPYPGPRALRRSGSAGYRRNDTDQGRS